MGYFPWIKTEDVTQAIKPFAMNAGDSEGTWKDLAYNVRPLFVKKRNAGTLEAQLQQVTERLGNMAILMEALPELAEPDLEEQLGAMTIDRASSEPDETFPPRRSG